MQDNYPQGAVDALKLTYGKSARDKILGKLKAMSAEDRAALAKWLMEEDDV